MLFIAIPDRWSYADTKVNFNEIKEGT